MGDNSLDDPEHLSVSSVKFCVATHGKLCHGLFTEVLVSPSGPKETWRRGLYVDGIFVICNLFSFFFFCLSSSFLFGSGQRSRPREILTQKT